MKIIKLLTFFFLSAICACLPNQTVSQTKQPSIHGKNIQFSWKPNVTSSDFFADPLKAYSNVSFSISSLTDSRKNKEFLGLTMDIVSKKEDTLTTKINITQWISKNIPNALNFIGIGKGKKERVTLECELHSFTLQEEQSQRGEIELGIVAKKNGDMFIWEGSVKASSDLYYKPGNSDGYSECLSNTLITTVYNILNEPSFRDAVIKSTE